MSSKVHRNGQVDVEVPATPEQVWAVLTDVTRIGEWSHECRTAQWLGGVDRPAVGARFRGSNKVRLSRWSKKCTITDLQPPRRFVYETSVDMMGGPTEWTFTLEPTETGCRVTQSFKIDNMPRAAEWLIAKMIPEHLERSQALRADLERLGALAANSPLDPDADDTRNTQV